MKSKRFAVIALTAVTLGLIAARTVAAPISWDDLKLPERTSPAEVELTGFLLPIDYEGDDVYQFMLLPWAGACSHTPPPPPDQVVLVTPEEPIQIERTYEAVSITGHLNRKRELSQFFLLDGVARIESEYRMRSAQVQSANIATVPPPSGQRNPWKFLKQ